MIYRIAFASALALPLLAIDASAAPRSRDYDGGSINSCSRFGHGCITGRTRSARFGLEVRMPGGTWISCEGSCKDTLARETIDFWDSRSPSGGEHRRH